MTSLKQGIIQDKEGIIMRTVFGIDVSKASSEVAILVNSETVHGYTMPNDTIGFRRLFLEDLKQVQTPEIVFEATGAAPSFSGGKWLHLYTAQSFGN